MKKTTFLFIAMVMVTLSVSAGTGWFSDFITLNVNGVEAPNNYYIGNNPGSGTAIEGTSFGTVSTLELSDIDLKYWADNGDDRTGGALFFKITLEDGTTEVLATSETMWTQVKLPEINDYQGIKPAEYAGKKMNLLRGLQTGTYKIHFWAKSWGTGGDSYLSNAGANYVATFSVVRPVTLTGTESDIDNTYETLKQAFDSINAHSDYTNKDIEIKIAGNTTETAGAALKQPTTASWNSLTIYPTVENVSITGDFIGNLIDLDGADKVTITGKLNKIGASKNLTIVNLKVDNGARTIRIWNDATINTITHCMIKGSCSSSGAGVVFISTAVTTGNDDVTISYNDFNKAGTTSPYSAIYAAGTSTKMNERVIIDNNNFFNLFSGGTFYAIRFGAHNSAATITNNNIYEPNEIVPIDDNNFYGISIAASTGDQFNISNNFIGGNAPSCVGTFKKSNAFSNAFQGIFVSVSASSSNGAIINGNVIKNFEWKNAAVKKDFNVIQAFGNAVNIGTTSGNTISDIVWENGAISEGVFYGINIQNTSGLNVAENNTISNITINNTDPAHGSNFYGLFKFNSLGSVKFQNNIISGISATGTSTGNIQIVAGVHCNYTSSTIRTFNFDIIGNNIYNISNASSRTDVGNSVYGIFVNPPQGSGTIAKNKIYNLTASDATLPARVVGINMDVTSTSTATVCSNNMISIGNNNPGLVYGILQNTGLGKVYHNSVYLAGSPVSGSYESSALIATGATTGREFINNILYNTRSNTGTADGKHYTVKYNATTNLTSDYNVVKATGIGGLLGAVGATDYATGNDWSAPAPTGTGLDSHSKVTDITFTAPATADLTLTGLSIQDENLKVPSLTAVTTDISGTTRNTVNTYAGAHESTLPFPTTGLDKALMQAGVHISKVGVEVRVGETSRIELYTLNGTLIDKAITSNSYSRALNNGMYIVKINGKAVKFVK